jgi:hypothetical protein
VSASKHLAVVGYRGREFKLDARKMEKSVAHPLLDTSVERCKLPTGGHFVLEGSSYGCGDVEHIVMFQPRDKQGQRSRVLR